MRHAIRCTGVVKEFGDTRALDGVDLEVGTAEVLGGDPWRDAVALHRRLAYVPGDVHLWPNLTGGEAIDLLGDLRGGLDPARRNVLLERFDLDPTKTCSAYSKGNRQKVALVAAFASDVELYVLDEPTSGLDPLMEAVFQDVVLEAKTAGRTVLLSSHILAEAETLSDRVSIIRRGRIVESGTLTELRHLTRTSVHVLTHERPDGLAGFAGVHELRTDDREASFEVETDHLDVVMREVASYGVVALTSAPPTLEELFMRHYGDDLPVAEASVA